MIRQWLSVTQRRWGLWSLRGFGLGPLGFLTAGHHALSLLESGWVGEEHLPHLRKQWVLQERGGGGRVLLELLHRAHRVVQQRRVAGRPLPGKPDVILNPTNTDHQLRVCTGATTKAKYTHRPRICHAELGLGFVVRVL